MNANNIEVGDIVDIFFTFAPTESLCTIIYAPLNLGEYWTLRRQDGTILNVMVFEKMVRLNEETKWQDKQHQYMIETSHRLLKITVYPWDRTIPGYSNGWLAPSIQKIYSMKMY
jgi:hypothetical protein